MEAGRCWLREGYRNGASGWYDLEVSRNARRSVRVGGAMLFEDDVDIRACCPVVLTYRHRLNPLISFCLAKAGTRQVHAM